MLALAVAADAVESLEAPSVETAADNGGRVDDELGSMALSLSCRAARVGRETSARVELSRVQRMTALARCKARIS